MEPIRRLTNSPACITRRVIKEAETSGGERGGPDRALIALSRVGYRGQPSEADCLIDLLLAWGGDEIVVGTLQKSSVFSWLARCEED